MVRLARLFLFAALFTMLFACQKGAKTVTPAGKPTAPISVTIKPEQKEFQAGDIVDFRVTAASGVDVPDLRLTVDVPDTLAIFSGDRQWRGPLKAGEKQILVLAIRIPETAGAKISATAVANFGKGQTMAARAVYVLGAANQSPTLKSRETIRDGRPTREYPLP